MPIYRARCVTQAGQFFAREFEAPNAAALRLAVESRGSFLLDQKELKQGKSLGRTKLSLPTLVQLFDLLAMQLGAGVPAEIAVAKLKDEFPNRAARRVLRGVHAELAGSTASLSGAFGKYPRSFPESLVAAIRVGEESGGSALAARLEELRDQIAFRILIRKTATRALAYPVFILVMAACVIGLLMVRLVPNIKVLLDSLNVPLPRLTLVILGVSGFVASHWQILVAAVVLLAPVVRIARALPPLVAVMDRLLLRLPLFGGILKALVTAEVAKNYRALYSAGVDAGSTFAACAGAVRNLALKRALLRARVLIETGVATAGNPEAPAITEALRSTGYFPELALTIIATGETSGNLARALDNVAVHYSTSAQDRIRTFFAVFDKAVMLALIVVVGAVVLGLWMPIMTAAQNLHY